MPLTLKGDITLNAVRYVPAVNVTRERPGFAFWRDGKVSLQEAEVGEVVSALWNNFGGGMGEVNRITGDSNGYSFTERMDASAGKFLRTSPRRITVAPSTAPGDYPTYFFEQTPTAADYAVDFITTTKSITSGVTTQAVAHGMSKTPVMGFVFFDSKTNETAGAGINFSIGYSDFTNHRGVGGMSLDAQADGTAASRMASAALTMVDTSSNTTIVEATLTSPTTTQITISYSANNTTAYVLHILLFAGSDINAKVIEWTMAASTGNQSFTGAGFTPVGAIHLQANVAPSTLAYDTSTTATLSAGTSKTFSHTCSASANRLLLVRINIPLNSDDQVSGVTYNGVAMTRIERKVYPGEPFSSYLYYLIAPANGANDVVVSFSTTVRAVMAAVSFTGVHQTTPYRTQTSTTAESTSYSTTYTSATGELVLSFLDGRDGSGGDTPAVTAGAGQTERYDVTGPPASGGEVPLIELSTEPGATSVTMSGTVTGYTFTPATIHTVIAIKPIATSTTSDTLRFGIGGSDANGNQFAVANASDETATTNTASRQSSSLCILNIDGDGAVDFSASHVSFDADGGTVNVDNAPSSAVTIFTLVFRGLQFAVTSHTKSVAAATAAQTLTLNASFTPSAYLLVSGQGTTQDAAIANARFGIGGSDGTQEEAIAWSDSDGQATSVTDAVSKTSKVFAAIDNVPAVLSEADHASFGAGTIGISWTTNEAVATRIYSLAFAARTSGTTRYVFMVSGQYAWKLQRSGTTITVIETHDFGGGAVAGRPAKFLGLWYVPLGPSVVFAELTTVAAGTGDTWTAAGSGLYALAFALYQDGQTPKLARAYSVNQVALASTGPRTSGNWGSGFSVGDTSSSITSMVDTGVALMVAKEDNLYRWESTGVSRPIFHLQQGSGDSDNGTGLHAIPGTETAIYNHQSGLMLFENGNIKPGIGPDRLPTNEAIPNVSHEPYLGRHYDTFVVGPYIKSLMRVVEGGSTRTYILDGEMLRGPSLVRWHSPDFEAGAARGLFVDSNFYLWTQAGGSIIARQLGKDGGTDAGRDTVGRGTASTQHRAFLSETPFYRSNGQAIPGVQVEIQHYEVYCRNVDSTCPLQIYQQRDGGTLETVGSAITTPGASILYLTSGNNDTAYAVRPVPDITTTSGYDNTTADPQIWSIKAVAVARPLAADTFKVVLDLLKPYANGSEQTGTPGSRRAALDALKGAASVTVVDPNGNTITASVTDVTDYKVEMDPNGEFVTYHVGLDLQERVTA